MAEENEGMDIDAVASDLASQLGGGKDAESQTEEAAPQDEQASVDTQGASEPPADGKATSAASEPAQSSPAQPTRAFDMARPPDTWGKEAQATWAALPLATQQAIAKREQDISKFVGESQPSLNVAKGFEKLLSPYAELYGRLNINPWNHLQSLMAAHSTLVFGSPEQKVQQFRKLALDAGIDISKLAAGQANADSDSQAHIRALQERIASLEQGVSGVTQAFNGNRLAELEAGVNAFAQDTKAHPFWDDVAADIPTVIAQGARTLQEAYETAVLRNPVTRGKLLESERQGLQAKAEQASRDKANAARKAMGGRVKASAQGRAATSLVGLDDFLKDTLGEIRSR